VPEWLHAFGTSAWGLAASAFVLSFLSGFVPVFSVELYLVSVSALVGPAYLVPVVGGCTLGQVLSKVLFYLAASGAIRLPFRKRAGGLASWRARIEKYHIGKNALLFLSAFVGFPPYYVMCILAGTLRLGLTSFVLSGLVGRALRFGVIYAFPELVKRWL
jgi:membrane protein YqaA with SNARE-associated domain